MLSIQESEDLVLEILTALNKEKEADEKFPVSKDTVLLGMGTPLDSLDLIYVITGLEDRIFSLTNREIQLVSEAEDLEGDHPFRTVSTLGEHITTILTAE